MVGSRLPIGCTVSQMLAFTTLIGYSDVVTACDLELNFLFANKFILAATCCVFVYMLDSFAVPKMTKSFSNIAV